VPRRSVSPGGGSRLLGLGPLETVLSGRRAWVAFTILLVALWVGFYHEIFFGGKSLVSPDAVAPAGFVKVGKEALENGVYPLWNPYIFLGMPSYSSLSYNPYVYPVGLLFKALWPLMRLPMMWLLIYYLAGGLSLFLLLRKLALPAAAAGFAAAAFMFCPNLVAVGAYGHGSQLMASMYVPIIFLMAHRVLTGGGAAYAAGLALLYGLQLLRGHVQISYYTAIMIGVMAIYWTVTNARERGAGGAVRPLALTALAVVLALGLCSVLYIPVHDYSVLSVRGASETGGLDIERAGMWSLSFKELATLLLPGALGFGGRTYWGSMPFTDYPNGYAGLLVLVFAVIGAIRFRRLPVVGCLLALAFLSLLMSFGRHLGPLYELAYNYLPFFNKFRVPVMVVVLFHFTLACLAGYGIASVIGGLDGGKPGRPPGAPREEGGSRAPAGGEAGAADSRSRDPRGGVGGPADRPLLWGMGVLAAAMLIFFAAGSRVQESYVGMISAARGDAYGRAVGPAAFASLRGDVLVLGLLLLCAGALILGYRRKYVSLGVVSLGLVFLCCADLWRVDYRLMEPNLRERGTALKQVEEDPVAVFLSQDKDLFRVYPLGRMFYDNTLNAHKIASVGGYHAAAPKLWDEWANAHLDKELWTSAGLRPLGLGRNQRLAAGAMSRGVRRMLGVKYVIADGSVRVASDLVPVFSERRGDDPRGPGRVVYRTDDWLPKAFCVPRVTKVETERDALREILKPSFDPEAFAVVEEEIELQPAVAGSARVVSYGVNHVEVEVRSDGPTYLVVGDLYMPGWSAKLDGDEVPIHKTNYLLRGVAMPAGAHAVRMEYFEEGLGLGLKLSAGSAIFIIVMVLPSLRRRIASGRLRRRTP